MKEIINSHNRKILKADNAEKNIQKQWNCRNKRTFLQRGVVYLAIKSKKVRKLSSVT